MKLMKYDENEAAYQMLRMTTGRKIGFTALLTRVKS